MNDTPQTPDSVVSPAQATPALPGPGRCFGGAVLAGGLALALYRMTSAIAQSFATKPVHSDNFTVQRISAAVRTLVVGMSALGTGIFGLAALGLLGLGIQLLIQRAKSSAASKGL